MRSVTGSKGSQQAGRYVIEDPRSVFYLRVDTKVIGYFEWEGPLGPHQFEGTWKDPQGKVVLVSDFQYEATKPNFAGYWTMLVSEAAPAGIWTLEAHIDGELAGSLSFQLVAAPKPPEATLTRPGLAPSQIYQAALNATVFVERLDADGKPLGRASGFFIGEGQILTAFEAIDGATSLRLIFLDGRHVEVSGILSWNRWEDWAILKAEPVKTALLPRAQANSWAVGDRCFFLDVAEGGGRVIIDGNITGKSNPPRVGERINFTYAPGTAAIGSPLLNEYGDVIGVLGGSLIPGAGALEVGGLLSGRLAPGLSVSYRDSGLATPTEIIPAPTSDARPMTLAELLAKGELLSPLARTDDVAFATLALNLDKRENPAWPSESREEFSHREQRMVVFVLWKSHQKYKGETVACIYDLDNRPRGQSKPLKLSLRPEQRTEAAWEFNIATLPTGIYRVDVLLGSSPAWRRFFRVIE